jgi:GMP synthase PP-ATPase subunit
VKPGTAALLNRVATRIVDGVKGLDRAVCGHVPKPPGVDERE